jgi:thiol:disulfide interchange protein DsbD
MHVRARLVPEASSIQPGRPFSVGLHLVIDRGWHVNWRNPGDAGLAPSLSWRLPPGFAAGPIEWPLPRRIVEGSLASYGYEDEIFLPCTIRPPATLAADSSVTLVADANWLECSDVCVPGKAELELTLHVSADEPAADRRYERLYSTIRDRLPREADPGSFAARLAAEEIVIQGTDPVTTPPDTVMFFPFERGVIDHAAPMRWSVEEGRLVVHLARPASRAGDPNEIEGVLYIVRESGGRDAAQILALSAPLSGGIGLAGPLQLGMVAVVLAAGAGWLALRRRKSSH